MVKKKVKKTSSEEKIQALKNKYSELVAKRFYDFPIGYYNEREAKSILMNEYQLKESEAMFVVVEVSRLIMVNLAHKTPNYQKIRGIVLGPGPSKVRIEE